MSQRRKDCEQDYIAVLQSFLFDRLESVAYETRMVFAMDYAHIPPLSPEAVEAERHWPRLDFRLEPNSYDYDFEREAYRFRAPSTVVLGSQRIGFIERKPHSIFIVRLPEGGLDKYHRLAYNIFLDVLQRYFPKVRIIHE